MAKNKDIRLIFNAALCNANVLSTEEFLKLHFEGEAVGSGSAGIANIELTVRRRIAAVLCNADCLEIEDFLELFFHDGLEDSGEVGEGAIDPDPPFRDGDVFTGIPTAA